MCWFVHIFDIIDDIKALRVFIMRLLPLQAPFLMRTILHTADVFARNLQLVPFPNFTMIWLLLVPIITTIMITAIDILLLYDGYFHPTFFDSAVFDI